MRRERRETTKKPSQEDMLLVQSIQITDKFGFDKQQQQQSKGNGYDTSETVFIASDVTTQGFCVNAIGKFEKHNQSNRHTHIHRQTTERQTDGQLESHLV